MAGKFRADGESQSGVDDPCGEAFPHRDLRRIAAGNFAREVVVNSPTETGCGDKERAAGDGKTAFLRERKENASQKDKREARADTLIHVFTENEPGDDCSRNGLKVEKKRGCAGQSGQQSQQQKRGTDHAPGQDGAREPREVCP